VWAHLLHRGFAQLSTSESGQKQTTGISSAASAYPSIPDIWRTSADVRESARFRHQSPSVIRTPSLRPVLLQSVVSDPSKSACFLLVMRGRPTYAASSLAGQAGGLEVGSRPMSGLGHSRPIDPVSPAGSSPLPKSAWAIIRRNNWLLRCGNNDPSPPDFRWSNGSGARVWLIGQTSADDPLQKSEGVLKRSTRPRFGPRADIDLPRNEYRVRRDRCLMDFPAHSEEN
jgi:hypothetical protein